MPAKKTDDVAIIGMSCRFPGEANDPASFWDLMINKKDAIEDIPSDRWQADQFYDPDRNAKGKMYTKQGGFIKDVDQFDNGFFKISPVEAESLDPQVRLMLELSYEAFENAGIPIDKIQNSATGVFAGAIVVDYVENDLRSANPVSINSYSVIGTQMSSISGRISYAYDLSGPSLTVDTACSSSLTAVHLACQSIWSGESSMALAGGVNMILSPKCHVAFSGLNALSSDCRSRAFDDNASGFVRSEGAGLILLKPLKDAQRDGDNILAVIPGSGINNDGASKGYTVPRASSQTKAIQQAWEKAGIGPDNVDYIEAHGTGTSVGDPLELEGIAAAIKGRERQEKLYLGSVKTNIGHCESAAGIAGIIKVVLSLQNGKIPANLHLKNPTSAFDWDKAPLQVLADAQEWKSSGRERYAGVTGLGLSGTNVHIIIKEAPTHHTAPVAISNRDFVLPISASDGDSLKKFKEQYLNLLKESEGDAWKSICAATAVHKSQLSHRFAAMGSSKSELIDQLESSLAVNDAARANTSSKKIAFVFPGQGSQWVGMGKSLLDTEVVFRNIIEACDVAIGQYTNWSLLQELQKGEANSRFGEVDVIQPTLFAIEVALAELWKAKGVMPDVVLGHSMGEVAAAHVAGVLSLDDAAMVICKRSQLARTVSGSGAMALTELTFEEAESLITDYEDKVAIGACNGPKSTVLSGDADTIEQLLDQLDEQQVFNRLIKVDYASHSPQMDQLKEELLVQLSKVSPQRGAIPVYSTVVNKLLEGSHFNAQYWSDNLRQPVLLSQAVQSLIEEEDYLFIEVSPHPILVQLLDQNIEHCKKTTSYAVHSLRRNVDESAELMTNLCALFEAGANVAWQHFYGGSHFPHHDLPAYPWQRQRFWLSNHSGQQHFSGQQIHPFLIREVRNAGDASKVILEGCLDTNALPFLIDHQVHNTIVFPATGYIEIVNAGLVHSFSDYNTELRDVQFKQPLSLTSGPRFIQLLFHEVRQNILDFRIYSAETQVSDSWELHCEGVVRLKQDAFEKVADEIQLDKVEHIPPSVPSAAHYEQMNSAGIQYGEKFQGVEAIWSLSGKTWGKIKSIDSLNLVGESYGFHPALLDACFQVFVATIPRENTETYLPSGINSYQLNDDIEMDGPLWVHIENPHDQHEENSYTRNIIVCNQEGKVLVDLKGFTISKLEASVDSKVDELFYKIDWEPGVLNKLEQVNQEKEHYLVFSNNNELWNSVRPQLIRDHQSYTLVRQGESFIRHDGLNELTFEIDGQQPDHFVKLITELGQRQKFPTRVLYFQSASDNLNHWDESESNCLGLTYFIQALNAIEAVKHPQLTVISSGAVQVHPDDRVNVYSAPLYGLARVAFHEHTELEVKRIDLSLRPENDIDQLVEIIGAQNKEKEVALRNGEFYVPRLNALASSQPDWEADELPDLQDVSDFDAWRFVTDEPGLLENVKVVEVERLDPAEDEIEVEVKATGLNFLNVMSALGICPGPENGFLCLGIEFSGVVTKTGKAVATMKVGDRVMGLSPEHDCLGKYTICKELQTVKIPDSLTYTEAASIGVAFGTAYACLIENGQLKKGERVLIHSAAGGVGLAAIEIAQNVGAEIYATAGTEEKRQLLKSMGIVYVMDSHSLDFAEEVMAYTKGEGVDVVLNSLSGEPMYQSMKLLRGFGRFLEIGKKDVYEKSNLQMDIFKESISYTYFDLHKKLIIRPDLVNETMKGMMSQFEAKAYRPIPTTVYPASAVMDGFNLMTTGKHIGKIVFDLEDPDLKAIAIPGMFDEDATYVITGGLGGLGFAQAEWMLGQGARNLVLTGRSTPKEEKQQSIDQWNARGHQVRVMQADVSVEHEVKEMLAEIRATMPPLKGIFHAAGILADASILKMNEENFRIPIGPKVHGANYLHAETVNDDLDYFVLFSSAASTLGSMGQANYVAANSYLDALSKARQQQKLPVTCINWGPVSEVGLAALQDNRGKRLANEGIANLSVKTYLEALEYCLKYQLNDINVLDLDVQKWIENNPTYTIDQTFSKLIDHDNTAQDSGFVGYLKSLSTDEEIHEAFKEELVKILGGILKTSVERVDMEMPFANMGLDSLMAIQFRNKLQKLLNIQVPVTTFWNYPKVRLLALHLQELLGLDEGNQEKPMSPAITQTDEHTIEEQVEQLTDDDLFTELEKEMEDL